MVLIPAAVSPHKTEGPDLTSPHDRLTMCRLATADDELFEVNDLELNRAGASYTIETARELKRSGWAEVNWLVGADQLMSLPKWKEPHALLDEVNFVVMARPGFDFDWDRLPPEFRKLRDAVVEAPLLEISATDIRRRVAAGEPIDDRVPRPVAEYIARRGLYR